jgi:hypothetical protein
MLNRPRHASWYRYVLGAGAVIALTAVGAAAMWTGWLPSRPLQWNDINGRLNLGDTGAAIRGDRPIVVNQWPSAGSLGYQARTEGLGFGSTNAATFAERFARRDDHDADDRGGAGWGASWRSRLAGTSGRSNFGGGIGGASGGLGTGGGVAQASKQNSSSDKTSKSPSAAKPSSPGNGGSHGSAPTPVPAGNPVTLADLATGIPALPMPSPPPLTPVGDPRGPGAPPIAPDPLPLGPSTPPLAPHAPPMAATPEPASIMLIGTGFLAAAGLIRRRRT